MLPKLYQICLIIRVKVRADHPARGNSSFLWFLKVRMIFLFSQRKTAG